MTPKPSSLVWPLSLAAVLLVLGFASLDDYNVTWDEALGDLFFGERYLFFFATGDDAYLDFTSDPFPETRQPSLFVSPFKIRPWEYYPVANALAALVSEILARRLGLLDVFDGFHASSVLLGALLLVVLHRMVGRRWGFVAATAAIGLLFTSPRIWVHLQANVKDFPHLALFSFTLLAFLAAWERGSPAGVVGSGVLWGLALGTKANALFLPAVPFAVALLTRPPAWTGSPAKRWGALVGAGLAGGATFLATWPYLWSDPVARLLEHLRYIGLRADITRPESVAPVIEAIVLTTPPLFLALAIVGLGPCLRRAFRRESLAVLVLAWPPAVLCRYALPQSINFDGVRHFLELFPALAILGGLGAATLTGAVARLSVRFGLRSDVVKASVLVLILVPGTWATVRTHPFQLCYWNAFADGYGGARAAERPQASDYWGTSYRLGLRWLDENALPGSYLAVPVLEHAVRLVAPSRLRDDIQLLPVTTPLHPRIAPERLAGTRELAREHPVYVMFVDRRDWRNELMTDCLLHLEPEVTWRLDGTPVLRIYRYRPP